MTYPSFYCIGVQKAGTTWLHKHLSNHPNIWLMPNELKELQYFNELHVEGHNLWTQQHREVGFKNLINKELKQAKINFDRIDKYARLALETRSDVWYSKFFSEVDCGEIAGDITPEYSLLPTEGIQHVKALTPNAKFILLLRHPVERDFSHIRMIARNHFGESLETLSDVELESFFLQAADHVGVSERSDYQAIIESWESVVGKEKLLILFYDDISEQPLSVLEQVCNHIGVNFDEGLFENASSKVFAGFEANLTENLKNKLSARHKTTVEYINDNYGRGWK
ncbi:sulfotransferase family protein [Alteromonas stellipolaris]|uniref:sulfotransferase family protein n=1 Tax=Alteromonas stellipolaris TaxID=233316 RepID=UPI001DA1D104|nr:sulfotransferase [Alteromonas stellipolaris]MBZ2163611.1 sulfotransferase [Alteromonas stellipolaris]